MNIFFQRFSKSFVLLAILTFFFSSSSAFAASGSFEVGGWIPYWRTEDGIKDAKSHLTELTRIFPFGYSVQPDGSFKDLADINSTSWRSLIKAARKKGVEIVPTMMWSDPASIQKILSDSALRKAHVEAIATEIKKGKYDGVDIDYEGKLSATKDYFSAFLRELKSAIGSKILTCTIEARTPQGSLSLTPAVPQYSNDYSAIGAACDRVQIMAYDQGRIDLKLNAARKGAPYLPVADIEWVRQAMGIALVSIPKEKIILGVATYGREYEVTVSPNWFQGYKLIHSVNADDSVKLADEYHITPSRNSGSEISFSYIASTSPVILPSSLSIPKDTPPGNVIAARALAYANKTGKTVKFNLVWWSDAEAIRQKVDLARTLGLRGVAIFKIDSKEDSGMWDAFTNQ